jgi:thiamine biosynthesis lipoprotein
VKLWRAGGPPSDAELAAAETCVGMRFLEVRPAEGDGPPEIRKTRAGVELDLDGIAPGYAVDQIGARLAALGSAGHLVELGGEVRAWGLRSDGEPWRVALHPAGLDRREARVIELSAGMALATSTIRPGGGAIDPRTGRRVERSEQSATVLAESCAEADAWAVAAVVLGLDPDDRGLVTPEALPKR